MSILGMLSGVAQAGMGATRTGQLLGQNNNVFSGTLATPNEISPWHQMVADEWMSQTPGTGQDTFGVHKEQTGWDKFLDGINKARNTPYTALGLNPPEERASVGIPQSSTPQIPQAQSPYQPMQVQQFNNPMQNQEVLLRFNQVMQSLQGNNNGG